MGLLDGQVAIVTGSTRGIGRAIAERLAGEGARVVVHGRRLADAQAAAAAIPGAIGLAADVADPAAVAALVADAHAALGRIDVLVNNAGHSTRAAITRVVDDDWDRTLAVNLNGPMYAARAVVPHMKAQGGGAIVNVISGAGTHGLIGFSAYAASKGGLMALTLTWALELAPFGIRVNALSPAALTDMLKELPPEVLQGIVDAGLPDAEASADATLFLVSDMSRATTGQVIDVTGAVGKRMPSGAL